MHGCVLVDWELQKRIEQKSIRAAADIEPDQIQPNSLDLRVGPVAYRIKASFLPVGKTVKEKLSDGLTIHEIDLSNGAFLERDAIYLIRVQEELDLHGGEAGRVNPKSTTGRLDIFCRAVCDYARAFDEIPAGYSGPLYLEVVSRSFMINVRAGDRLSQLRLSYGDPIISDEDTKDEYGKSWRLFNENLQPLSLSEITVRDGIHFGVNLRDQYDKTIGYYATPNHQPVTLSRSGAHPSRSYWGRVHYRGSSDVILGPNNFYIFASSQLLAIGPTVCAEMQPYDAGMGELRSHYAGFFDSGFGWGERNASRIVLEVRNHHVPYMLSHGQTLFRVHLLRNSAAPRRLYGDQGSSHYQGQGLRLAKQFMRNESEADLSQYVDAHRQQTLFDNVTGH